DEAAGSKTLQHVEHVAAARGSDALLSNDRPRQAPCEAPAQMLGRRIAKRLPADDLAQLAQLAQPRAATRAARCMRLHLARVAAVELAVDQSVQEYLGGFAALWRSSLCFPVRAFSCR